MFYLVKGQKILLSKMPLTAFPGCQLYAMLGGIFGTLSLMTMIVIGYDRYNVIVKGFTGVKITPGKVNTVY
jgi:hypothetical protein